MGVNVATGRSEVGEENVNLRDLLGVIYRANFHPSLAAFTSMQNCWLTTK